MVTGLVGPQLAAEFGDHVPGGSGAQDKQGQLVDGSTTDLPFVVEPSVRFEKADPPEPSRTAGAVTQPPRSAAAGIPYRLFIPRLGVDAPVISIETDDERVLLPPDDPQTLGWWSEGARPGARYGGALITGHTVSTGGGAFDNLDTLVAGNHARVRTPKGDVRYKVTGVTIYRKSSLAKDAARVFSQEVPGRLVLVTCEEWNGEVYLSNAVVFAEPLPGR